VARSTLADANESHDWRIYADFAGSAQESDDLPEKAGFLEKALWLA